MKLDKINHKLALTSILFTSKLFQILGLFDSMRLHITLWSNGKIDVDVNLSLKGFLNLKKELQFNQNNSIDEK